MQQLPNQAEANISIRQPAHIQPDNNPGMLVPDGSKMSNQVTKPTSRKSLPDEISSSVVTKAGNSKKDRHDAMTPDVRNYLQQLFQVEAIGLSI